MHIKFKSYIKNQDKKNEIIFKAPLKISKLDQFDVYEFKEPNNNIWNRIEISAQNINVFAGPSTIYLSLNKVIANEYNVQNNIIQFESKMIKLNILENKILFEYFLFQSNKVFGHFIIELEIEK